MNDKIQLAAMGEHMAEQQPLCMAKRIEELEAQVRVMAGLLREAVAWMDDHPAMPDSSMMHAALAGKLLALPAAPEGWQLVPVEPTERMISESIDAGRFDEDDAVFFWASMLASAPSPDGAK